MYPMGMQVPIFLMHVGMQCSCVHSPYISSAHACVATTNIFSGPYMRPSHTLMFKAMSLLSVLCLYCVCACVENACTLHSVSLGLDILPICVILAESSCV
jgi:hypothetical protein